MGKKSKKKTGAASRQQSNSNNRNSTPVAAAAAAAVANAATTIMEQQEEIQQQEEPIAEFDMDAWEARFPFAKKTSDPQAKDLDKAREFFLEGIQYAKNNDFANATEFIASAFLLDERVVILHDKKRNDDRYLDFGILNKMSRRLDGDVSLSVGILSLILALSNDVVDPNKAGVVVAMKFINSMLDLVTEETLETLTLGIMGGLTMAKVYYWRGRLFKDILNGKSAIQDWTKALELDPALAVARLARLRLWNATEMKTHAEIHAECVIFLGMVHQDYSELDAIYALMAQAIYLDARLGTYADAMEYYRKSLEATRRRIELYGPRAEPDDIIRHVRQNMRLSYEDPERAASKARKLVDNVLGDSPFSAQVADFIGRQQNVDKTKRNYCLNCKKQDGINGVQLRKCSRCKKVYFCSQECIRANWKSHKLFCNEISGHKCTPTQPFLRSPTPFEPNL